MISRSKKESILKDAVQLLEKSRFLIFTDPTALPADKNLELRKHLKKVKNSKYQLIKKTILKLALEKAGIKAELPEEIFKNSVAVAFLEETDPDTAKLIYKFSKENEGFLILGGLLENRGLGKEKIIQFAKLPPKEVLLAQLASVIQSPVRNLAVVLQANLRNLVYAISQIKK